MIRSAGTSRRQSYAIWIIAGIILLEGFPLVLWAARNPSGFLPWLGFAPGRAGNPAGWVLAALVTAAYVVRSAQIPQVRNTLFGPTPLKFAALVAALMAGTLEEIVFRRWVMNDIAHLGYGPWLQIAAAGLTFGAVHAIWGLMGRSALAAGNAALHTSILGVALAVVYLVAGRSLAPCIVAHIVIDALIEPGLVLAALGGEMGTRRPRRTALP